MWARKKRTAAWRDEREKRKPLGPEPLGPEMTRASLSRGKEMLKNLLKFLSSRKVRVFMLEKGGGT